LVGYRLVSDAGFYTLSGQPAILNISVNQGGDAAYLPHIGSLLRNTSGAYSIVADTGLYSITGSESLSDYEMGSAQGTYGLAGQDAGLRKTSILVCEAGTYSVSGQDVIFAVGGTDRVMPAEFGTYAISGQDNFMSAGYRVAADQGFYALLGQAATLSVGATNNYTMLAEPGAYTVFGIDALFDLGDPILSAETGYYEVTGYEIFRKRRQDAGHRRKRPRKKYEVEIDGEVFTAQSEAEALYVLEKLKEEAEATAKLTLERANKRLNTPIHKIIKDAEKALVTPEVEAEESIEDPAQVILAEIAELYADTLRTIEIAALLRKQEEEEEEALLLMLI